MPVLPRLQTLEVKYLQCQSLAGLKVLRSIEHLTLDVNKQYPSRAS